MKETELLGDFIADVFGQILGYTGPAGATDRYTLKREATVQVDGKFADAALGRFSTAGAGPEYVAAVEGKGPRDPLDRPFAGRKLSAVDQALRYAVNLVCDWYLVTNLHEIRLYHKGHDQFTFERFETATLAVDDAAFRRFVFLLGAERVVPATGRCHLDELLSESRRIGLDLTPRLLPRLRRSTPEDFLPLASVQFRRAAGSLARRHTNDARPCAVHRLLRGPRPVAAGVHRQSLPSRRSLQPTAHLGQLPGAVPVRGSRQSRDEH